MKGQRLICEGLRRIQVEEFELPCPGPDEILVQNHYTAISVGTEIYNWLHGAEPGGEPRFPRPTGYCSTGAVVDAGLNVKNLKVGDRVAAQGNHASHDILKGSYYPVPAAVESEEAAFLVMAAIALHGIRKARIELGESLTVLGLGVVGQLALTLARLCGAMPTIALDLDRDRLQLAGQRGADLALNPDEERDVVARVREQCMDDGANVVIEATGKPAVYPLAVQLACMGGRVIALGSPRGTVEMNFMADVHLREVEIIGAIQPRTPEQDHIYYHWTKDRDRSLLLDLMGRGRLQVAELITHRCRPDECQAVYEMLADRPQEALGVIFDWNAA